MHPERHAVRFAIYAGLWLAFGSGPHVAEGCSRRRARSRTRAHPCDAGGRRARDPRERAIATVAVPALMAFTDAAKMAGYAAGLSDRLTETRR